MHLTNLIPASPHNVLLLAPEGALQQQLPHQEAHSSFVKTLQPNCLRKTMAPRPRSVNTCS